MPSSSLKTKTSLENYAAHQHCHTEVLRSNRTFAHAFCQKLQPTQKYAKVFILNNFLSALIFTHLYLIRAIHLFRFFNCSHHFSNCVMSSKGLKTFCRSLFVTCKYRSVVFISLCPSNLCIITTSIPLSSKCVAKLCRNWCMLPFL